MKIQSTKVLSRFYSYFSIVLNDVFFGELVFTLLPIAAYYFMMFVLKRNYLPLGLTPEFAFVNVVLGSSALSHFIHLKTYYQNDKSSNVYSGLRLVLVLIILAVVIYVLLLIGIINDPIINGFIENLQYGVFCLIVFTIILSSIYKGNYNIIAYYPPKKMNLKEYHHILNRNISRMDDKTQLFLELLKIENKIILSLDAPESEINDKITNEKVEMLEKLEKIKKNIEKAERYLTTAST